MQQMRHFFVIHNKRMAPTVSMMLMLLMLRAKFEKCCVITFTKTTHYRLKLCTMIFEPLETTPRIKWEPKSLLVEVCCSIESDVSKKVDLMKWCVNILSKKMHCCDFKLRNVSVH